MRRSAAIAPEVSSPVKRLKVVKCEEVSSPVQRLKVVKREEPEIIEDDDGLFYA